MTDPDTSPGWADSAGYRASADPPKLIGARWYYRRRWRTRESLLAGGWVLPPATKLERMVADARTPAEIAEIEARFGTRRERVPVAPRLIAELEG